MNTSAETEIQEISVEQAKEHDPDALAQFLESVREEKGDTASSDHRLLVVLIAHGLKFGLMGTQLITWSVKNGAASGYMYFDEDDGWQPMIHLDDVELSKTFEHPSGDITLTIDFEDSEEREATIWVKADNYEDAQDILNKYIDWVEQALSDYDVSIHDSSETKHEIMDEGGFEFFLEFPSDE